MDEMQTQNKERQRQQAIDRAVQAADRIILDTSDGSVEETNYLTAEVAKKFFDKVHNGTVIALMKKDLGLSPGVQLHKLGDDYEEKSKP